MFKIGNKKKRKVRRQPARRTSSWNWQYPLYGLGCFMIFITILWTYLNWEPIVSDIQKWAIHQTQRVGFVLKDVVVVGRHRTTTNEILEIIEVEYSDPLYAFDAQEAKEQLEKTPWVESAHVQRRLPNSIFIHLEETKPVALWQYQGKHKLIDTKGNIIEDQDPRKFSDLIHVVGRDAASHAPALIRSLDDFPSLRKRVTAVIHQHGERWDMRIDDKIDIKLPEDGLANSLRQLQELDEEYDFSQGEIMTIDMRFPDKLILRLTPEAIKRRQMSGRDA